MATRLQHRGPDATTSIKLEQCHLGHNRLSIIDLTTGDQPMYDESKRYWISLNGEIYNYRELRASLETLGYRFRTTSDTEVLLQGYIHYQDDVLHQLNGQFAFMIWDVQERALFAARDRMGEKPLYWAYSTQGHLLLASEIKGLLASGLVEPRLDLVSVEEYLRLLYVPPHRTIYENVHTLQPGHAFRWKAGNHQIWEYWHPKYSGASAIDAHEAVEQVGFLLDRAVKRQMVADVPVGAILSGGLDSSTIVALMTRHTEKPIMTFSVGFGDLINELPFAREVANAYKTDHHELQMEIDVAEMLEEMSGVYDEPFADSSNIPTYLIAKFARQYVKVALSGDGGDELFGGYDWYKRLLSQIQLQPSKLITAQAATLTLRALVKAGLPFQQQRDLAIYKQRQILNVRREPDMWIRHGNNVSYFNAEQISSLFTRSSRAQDDLRNTYQPSSNITVLDRAVDFDVRCYLPGDILVKVDRAALAHGLESRAPFLDVDLVEFVLSLPWALRFKEGTGKYLLRESYSHLWPDMLKERTKQGVGAPIHRWINYPAVQNLLRRVTASSAPLTTLMPNIADMLTELNPQQKWAVLCLGLWLDRHPECIMERLAN